MFRDLINQLSFIQYPFQTLFKTIDLEHQIFIYSSNYDFLSPFVLTFFLQLFQIQQLFNCFLQPLVIFSLHVQMKYIEQYFFIFIEPSQILVQAYVIVAYDKFEIEIVFQYFHYLPEIVIYHFNIFCTKEYIHGIL